jgi:hypothetical protein
MPVYNRLNRLVRFVYFYKTFVVGAEGFKFMYFHLESCGLSDLL